MVVVASKFVSRHPDRLSGCVLRGVARMGSILLLPLSGLFAGPTRARALRRASVQRRPLSHVGSPPLSSRAGKLRTDRVVSRAARPALCTELVVLVDLASQRRRLPDAGNAGSSRLRSDRDGNFSVVPCW